VDYAQSPTKIDSVRLSILVPPSPPVIYDDHDIPLSSLVGPFHMGSNITLKCISRGGHPLPILVWTRNGGTLNTTYQVITHKTKIQSTVSVLVLTNLQREDDGSIFQCLAHSQASHTPLVQKVSLDLILPPTSVNISVESSSMTAGHWYNISCLALGSSPFVLYNWTLSSPGSLEQKYIGNSSVIEFLARIDHHNSSIHCIAFNPLLPDTVVRDSINIIIHYKPKVSLNLGKNIEMNKIKEGEDIYLECSVDSRPEPYKLFFKLQGDNLDISKPGRKLVSKGILVIQNITKSDAGAYECVAENDKGVGISEPVKIQVLYSPVCQLQHQLLGLSVGDEIDIPCTVSANPQDLTFHWFFNKTKEAKEFIQLPVSSSSTGNSSSLSQTVTYLTRSTDDYGTLLCYASNSIGHQLDPCVSHIIPSGPPDPVTECQTGEPDPFIVMITCTAGYDGGLMPSYTAELYTSPDHSMLQSTVTNTVPEFSVYNLPPGTRFYVKIFAVNAKGRSSSVDIKASTVKETSRLPLLPPEQSFYDNSDMVYINPPVPNRPSRLEQTIFIVLASLAGLAFIVIITLLLCRFQCQMGDNSSNRGSSDNCEVHTATTSTSPLSARELVEISLLHTNSEADMGSDPILVSVPASGSVLSTYPLLIPADRQQGNNSSETHMFE